MAPPFRKIDASSHNAISSALGFFETPHTNTGISSWRYEEILTLNPVEQPPYHLRIHPTSSYIDLDRIYVQAHMHIEKPTTTGYKRIDSSDKVATIQAIGATWIEDMRVLMNGRETFNANKLYAYKSYFDIELSYPMEVKENYLGIIGYFPCKMKHPVTSTTRTIPSTSAEGSGSTPPPATTTVTTTTGSDKDLIPDQNSEFDTGYQKRRDMFASGKTVQFFTKLNADIFATDLYLINAVPIDIEIHPNSSAFLIHQTENKEMRRDGATEDPQPTEWRLVIESVKMYVRTVELMDGLALEIARHLERQPARYGIRKSELKSLYISQGRQELQANIFAEQVPRRIVVGMVEAKAFNGHAYKSPFVFGNYRVDEITVSVGGVTVPSVRYKLDYDQNHYMRAYNDMMEGIGMANTVETNGISPLYYKHGWAIYVFSMGSEFNSNGFELMKSGTTSIYVHFARPITHGVNMVVYGELGKLRIAFINIKSVFRFPPNVGQ